MRRVIVFAAVVALVSAACGTPPQDAASVPISGSVAESSTSIADVATTTTISSTRPPTAADTTTSTTSTAATAGFEDPDIELLPPLSLGELVDPEMTYLSFSTASGVDAYTAVMTTIYDTAEGVDETIFEVFVDGGNIRMRTATGSDGSGEVLLANYGDDGMWTREDAEAWEPVVEPTESFGYSTAALALAGPEGVYEQAYAIFDRLTFVGWEEVDGVALAHYSGDLTTAALLAGGEEEDVSEAASGGVDVWLDPRGFFARYEVAIEMDGATYTQQWLLSDIGTTTVELPA